MSWSFVKTEHVIMRINFMGGIARGFTRKTVNLHVELVSDGIGGIRWKVALSTLFCEG
jgi:hypothetical protein